MDLYDHISAVWEAARVVLLVFPYELLLLPLKWQKPYSLCLSVVSTWVCLRSLFLPTVMRHSTYLEVRLANIAHNVGLIRRHYAPHATLIPMVKGNAYGNGLSRVAGYLHDHCGVHHFGVAALGEATALLEDNSRTINASAANNVVVFSDTEVMDESLHEVYRHHNGGSTSGSAGPARLWPVLGSARALDIFCKHRSTAFRHTPLCLKVNTGMNRLGLTLSELQERAPLLREHGGVDLLVQHFSVSGLVGHSFTKAQYERFQDAKALLSEAGVEVRATTTSNSGAIEQRIGVEEETYVRPGLMLYGPTSLVRKTIPVTDPPQYRLWDGKACGYFYTKVLAHYVVKAGSYVGYGLTRNLVPEDAVVVVLPIGYADGFLRYYTNMPVTVTPAPPRGCEEDPEVLSSALVGEAHGNVNMDMVAVVVYPSKVNRDLSTIMREVKDDSEVLVWGADVAEKAVVVKSIPYQLMCGLSIRVPRVYME